MYEIAETLFHTFVGYCIIVMECIGVIIIMITSIRSLIGYFKGEPHIRIELAEGISLALLFKMGGEVMRTIVVRTWEELGILAAIMIIRALITFLLHWEVKNEKTAIESLAVNQMVSFENQSEAVPEYADTISKDSAEYSKAATGAAHKVRNTAKKSANKTADSDAKDEKDTIAFTSPADSAAFTTSEEAAEFTSMDGSDTFSEVTKEIPDDASQDNASESESPQYKEYEYR